MANEMALKKADSGSASSTHQNIAAGGSTSCERTPLK